MGPFRLHASRVGAVTLLVFLAGGALLASTFRGAALPMPPPYAGEIPRAEPPATMAIYGLVTGVTHRSAGFGYRGGSLREARDFAMGAILVKHPRGDLLIDTGLGARIDAQVALMPFWFRATTRYTRARTAAEQLDAAGYDRRSLRAVLLTHAHWDHASGLPDFPGTPVWVTPEEHRFIAEGGWITAVARSAEGARYEEYGFEGGPYLGFPSSHDVYGDGAVVVVPASGHTPGSVIVFLSLPDGKRYALLGDMVWQREGVTEREERPWLMRSLADSDPSAVREGIVRMASIEARIPGMTLVPAHDLRAYGELPALTARQGEGDANRPR